MNIFPQLLQVLEGDYILTFEPKTGYLEPREERTIKLTFTGHKKVVPSSAVHSIPKQYCPHQRWEKKFDRLRNLTRFEEAIIIPIWTFIYSKGGTDGRMNEICEGRSDGERLG